MGSCHETRKRHRACHAPSLCLCALQTHTHTHNSVLPARAICFAAPSRCEDLSFIPSSLPLSICLSSTFFIRHLLRVLACILITHSLRPCRVCCLAHHNQLISRARGTSCINPLVFLHSLTCTFRSTHLAPAHKQNTHTHTNTRRWQTFTRRCCSWLR